MTSQPDHSLADEPMIDEPLAAESQATAGMTPESPPDDSETDADEETDTYLGEDADLGPRTAVVSVAPPRLSEQWHDIQAMFVDDPPGSVQRAAQAADAAVAELSESLRQRQAALAPAGTSDDAHSTEQLREALREYRVFCERLAALAEELAPAGAMG